MPRFVILCHDHPHLHWDLMLEHAGVLRTWRLSAPPLVEGLACASLLLSDHRLAYLDYEGPVSGNRGSVARWDSGEYQSAPCPDPDVEVFRMKGDRGEYMLKLAAVDPPWGTCKRLAGAVAE